MPACIATTLRKLDSVSETNHGILNEFVEHMRSKDRKSDRNLVNQLELMISFDKFYGGQSFTSITSKEQILTFLNHRYDRNNGRWIEREHDEEGRYIETWNRYRGLIITFFRWLTNRSRPDDEWETPPFLKIKAKKPLRDSPYDINDIWEVDEMLEIVQYEPELRNQAIITLSWDANGRPHEITAQIKTCKIR